MSEAVQELLNIFYRLEESERKEAYSEILKLGPELDESNSRLARSSRPLTEEDEELIQLAEMNFREFDAQEAADANSRAR